MKKKPFALLLALCALFVALAVFSACGGSDSATGSANNLTYGKKYIYASDITQDADQQDYLVFYSNKTGEYHAFVESLGRTATIKFKYVTTADESVFCFYDSVEYGDDETSDKSAPSKWSMTISSYSPEIVYTSSRDVYICETYLEKEIPNYGK